MPWYNDKLCFLKITSSNPQMYRVEVWQWACYHHCCCCGCVPEHRGCHSCVFEIPKEKGAIYQWRSNECRCWWWRKKSPEQCKWERNCMKIIIIHVTVSRNFLKIYAKNFVKLQYINNNHPFLLYKPHDYSHINIM